MSTAKADGGTPTSRKDKDLIDTQRFANYRKVVSSFTTLAYGHAGKPKVLHYDLGALVRKGAFHTVFATKASIFTMDSSLAKSQILYMFWFTLMGTVSYLFMPDKHLRGMQELEKFTNYWNVFIPFILGLYIALNITRWWTLRTEGLGMVLDAAQNVVLLMNGIFPGAEYGDVHDQVLKYGLASVSLIVNACRGNDDVESLGPKGDNLFTNEEMEVVYTVPYRARPVLMWTWILMLLSKVCDENNVNAGKFRDIAGECKKARNGISVIWTYLRTQLPFAYVHLVTFMVNLNNFFVSVKCGILFALAVKQNEHSRALNQFFFVCIVPPLYQALLTISYVIHDPFGEDLLDFPVMAFQEYMNEAAVSMSSMGYKCPSLTKTQLWLGAASLKKDQDALDKEVLLAGSDGMAAGTAGLIEKELVMEDVIKDTVFKLERSMNGQADAKDEVISMLRERIKWLESNLSGMKGRLEMLEGRMANSSGSAGSDSGCAWATIQRGKPAGRPVAMAPNGVPVSVNFSKSSK
jgi:predicted membrane chloride channel (bestrophin family)